MEWISVKDRLPDKHCYDTQCYIMFSDGHRTLSNYGTVLDHSKLIESTLTHWMPQVKSHGEDLS